MDKFSWKRFIEVMSKKYKRFSDFESMLDDFKDEIMDYVGKSETYFVEFSSWDFHLLISNLSIEERKYIWQFTDVLIKKDKQEIKGDTVVDFDDGVCLYYTPILQTSDKVIQNSNLLKEILFYAIFLSENDKTTWGEVAEKIGNKDNINILKLSRMPRCNVIPIEDAKKSINEDIKRLFEKFKKYL